MALLQNDKAIFYHPLDDSTETLKAQAWAGAAAFTAGKVSLGLKGVLGDSLGAFGPAAEFVGSMTNISVMSLSATKFVVAYRDRDDASHGTAKVGTVSGTSITYGAETEFLSTGALTDVALASCPLSSTKFVIAYRDFPDFGHGTAKVGTVSGTDITFGAEAEFNSAGDTESPAIVAIAASTFVVVYQDVADSDKGKAKVGTVSGTDITFGAEAEFAPSVNSSAPNRSAIASLTATKVVVAYRDVADAQHGTTKVGTVSGTDITFGAEVEFESVGGSIWISAVGLDATKFVVVSRDQFSDGRARVGTVSGTDITYGTNATFETGTTSDISMTALSTTAVVVTYSVSLVNGTAKIGIVSGTDIAFGTNEEFLGTAASTPVPAALDASTFVVAYGDGAGVAPGEAKVGSQANVADITGTGASYNSAAAATKVAFAGWLQNPST